MIEIIPATTDNIPDIQKISAVAWPHTFKDILSEKQIAFMMHWMYSDESCGSKWRNNITSMCWQRGEEFAVTLV